MPSQLKSPAAELSAGNGALVGKFQAMNCPCEILMDTGDREKAQRLLDAGAAEAGRIENKFSRYRAGNIVDQINRSAGQPVSVDEETAQILNLSPANVKVRLHRARLYLRDKLKGYYENEQ